MSLWGSSYGSIRHATSISIGLEDSLESFQKAPARIEPKAKEVVRR